jgi:hypothetical protein
VRASVWVLPAQQKSRPSRLFCVAFPSFLFFVALLAGRGKHVDMIHIDFPDQR